MGVLAVRGVNLLMLALLASSAYAAAPDAHEACVVVSQQTEATREAVRALSSVWRGKITEVAIAAAGSQEQAYAALSQPRFAVHVAIGSEALALCSKLDTGRPVLYAMVLDPERHIATRRNTGGVLMLPPPEIELRTLLEISPGVRRVLTLYSPGGSAKRVEAGKRAASALGLTLVALEASSPEEAARILRDHKDDFDAFWMLPDQKLVTAEVVQYLLLLSFQRKAPVVAATRKLVERGFLFCLSPVASEVGTLLGKLVNQVAQGGKAEVVSPADPELALNMKTANSLGLDVPRAVRSRATAVY